jgi:DNA adenine methylase
MREHEHINTLLAAARRTLASLHAAAPEDVEKRVFRSPAGKRYVVRFLLPLIPEHRRYVEPFAGSAALYFAKEPATEEVLSDLDPEIAFAYRFVQRMTPETLERLKRLYWKNSRPYFEKLKAREPASDLERFHKFVYLNRFSYFSKPGRHASYNPHEEGQVFEAFDKFLKGKERLKDTTILRAEYQKVIRRYDGPGTFFFLDPPFPGYDQSVGEKHFDEERFARVLAGIRGKFLVTYGVRSDLSLFKAFHQRRLMVPTATPRGLDERPLLLIANYELKKRTASTSKAAAKPSSKAAIAAETTTAAPASQTLMSAPASEEAISQTSEPAPQAPAPEASAAPPEIDAALRPFFDRAVDIAQAIVKRGPDEERFTLGIVLEPDVVDAQNDRYTKEEVRRACHRFAEYYGHTGLMHRELANGRIVILENYLAPCDFTAENGELVKEGTWLQGRRYRDDEIWQRIKQGELTGLSIGGSAIRRCAQKDASAAGGETEE